MQHVTNLIGMIGFIFFVYGTGIYCVLGMNWVSERRGW